MGKKKNNEPKSRKFIISWNNYPPNTKLEEILEKLKRFKLCYCILSFEVGEKEHTPHIQGYVHFENAIQLNTIRKILDNQNGTYGFAEIAYGNDYENQNYCSKQNKFIEYGKPKYDEEYEYDVGDIVNDIINNMPYLKIIKKYPKYTLYHYDKFKKLYMDLKVMYGNHPNEDKDISLAVIIESERYKV